MRMQEVDLTGNILELQQRRPQPSRCLAQPATNRLHADSSSAATGAVTTSARTTSIGGSPTGVQPALLHAQKPDHHSRADSEPPPSPLLPPAQKKPRRGLSPTRLLHERSSGGRRPERQPVRRKEEDEEGTETESKNESTKMCGMTSAPAGQPLEAAVAPPATGGVVKIVRMSRGKRMSEEAFAALPEKEQLRVLRNRRNALQTRSRRQARIATLTTENSLLEASVKLKERQIAVLLQLLGDGSNPATVKTPAEPAVASSVAV